MFRKNRIVFYHQLESTDCGAACLAMILSYFGKNLSLSYIKTLFEFTRIGVSVQDIIDASKKVHLNSVALKVTPSELEEIPLPCILYWKQDHFVVLEKISEKKKSYSLIDPSYGKITLDKEIFYAEWKGDNEKGIVIYSEPESDFDTAKYPKQEDKKLSESNIFIYALSFVKTNRLKYLYSLVFIIIGLITNWFIPFSFQKIIDLGISAKALQMIYYLLAAQFVLFLSNFIADFLSQLILTKINFTLSIDLRKILLQKILKLPISFFDTKVSAEVLQRLNDQQTVQNFLTWKGISLVLDILNILVFGGILLYFNFIIFGIYAFLSLISIFWVVLFLKNRKILEYAIFLKQSENSNSVYEFIMNMPEIKINNAQKVVINKIIKIQENLNKLELRSLILNTYQNAGVNILSKLKEIIAIGICAIFIIEEKMTLGSLLGISYIIGQLAGPVQNLLFFIKDAQDTDIANKRIELIYDSPNEDNSDKQHIENTDFKNIKIENISFKYPGKFNNYVLKDISFNIPANSVTAIVGASGSGKTTLMKLLLSYYPVNSGKIALDKFSINDVFADEWRKKCGIVLQNGNIFSGTIANNIALSDETIDIGKIQTACKIAGIQSFIEQLPMHYYTKIGNTGIQLSGGQQQRILIARAVYKNPQYIFFDEATSALDAENEKIIHDNLQEFFKGKTVLIIAHRLSTVKNADRIIVLKNGQIAEQGTHQELVALGADYFHLVKNQLELGG
ncbi:MAG: peptidase domain-containing ABC transporter [Flavobacteriaceae bacterium]|jgi:ATP-binding cassette subfamily B protein|nr:peptidase domain-containing ABC transporter [Flavobacteriaceae bacterium]